MIAAFIFGAADAVADQLGVAGVNSNMALMTPYIITILALVLVGVRVRRGRARRRRPPPDSPVSTGPGRRMSRRPPAQDRVDCDPDTTTRSACSWRQATRGSNCWPSRPSRATQTLEKVTRNALAVATIAGIDVPIAAGADRPLVRPQIVAPEIHGESGLDGPVLPEPSVALDPRHGVDLLVETVMAHEPGTVTLVPTGPLTNVALALRLRPEIVDRSRASS